MKQMTAKTVVDVLKWIEGNGHHKASIIAEKGFFVLEGRGVKLRIPDEIQKQTYDLVVPSPHQFDTRMYRASKKGLALLRKHEKALAS